ncbi:MAG: nucleic acid-binding protein [Pseudanabaena sp.]|nr:MAG: nucleic acid-binding protein [Pseudanabaena sp.]
MLLDTSGLLCFLHKNEPKHLTAVNLIAETKGVFLTHNYVLAELIALSLVRGFPQARLLPYMLEMLNNPKIKIVWVDEHLHQEAIELLLSRQDKTYSLCDAVSFVLMRKYELSMALTTDKHFEQEGFIRLLTPET